MAKKTPKKKKERKEPESEGMCTCILIPKERIAILIGKKGEIRRRIERETGTKVEVESESGEVTVTRFPDKDALTGIKALDVIKAIARGFSPQKAFKLLSDNIYIEIIDMTDYLGDSPRTLKRIRSRIIGREGKSRKYISKLTGTDIVVYNKSVGIIGDADGVNLAKDAVFKLMEGRPHSAVFRSLEMKQRTLKE